MKRARTQEDAQDSMEEIKEMIGTVLRSAHATMQWTPSDKKLIQSVVKFKDRIVREVMVPRVDLFALPASTSIRDASSQLVIEGFSRIPIFRDNIDSVMGMLMFKDVLKIYRNCLDGKEPMDRLDLPVQEIAKEVFYTPETKRVSQLLQDFRVQQMHLAIVVDEYGGTEGIVTLEDLVEEIIGDISDEYDNVPEELFVLHTDGRSWIVDARMTIHDIEEEFAIQIPQEGEYDTLGGYIFHKVGTIPEQGLIIHHEEFDLEILSSSERSVDQVKISPRR